jgi:transglutaminase-like putative cysteine protease
MKRFVLVLFVALSSFFCLAPQQATLAQTSESPGDFETSLQTSYVVQDTGTTTVLHTFAVKNLKPTTYLKEYTLTTNFPQLQKVGASSNTKDITPIVKNEQAKTILTIPFQDEVVGQGKTRTFKVQYDIPNMAVVAGQVLEVQLPPLTSPDTYSSHIVTLKTPLKYGRAVRVRPEPISVAIENQLITTTFDQSKPQAISAFFGEKQIYSLTLRYNLENNSSGASLAQIALPPDTSFQRVNYQSLEPATSEIKRDEDGNWLATYELPPNTAQTVYLQADVQVTLDPINTVPVIKPEGFHTADKKYWETSNSNIKAILEGKSSVKELYDYVVDNLHYSYDTVQENSINHRLGAAQALQQPSQAVCQEFTDLFIALARAKGTPARRLTGFAYTQNSALRPLSLESDILHAWPEYYNYDRQLWKPVDPTWEATTGGVDYFDQFDLNHVVFAINGKSSTTPYPAGSYKGTDLTTKDVESTFSNTFPVIRPDIELIAKPSTLLGVAIPGKYKLIIINKTGQAWYDVKINVTTSESDQVKLNKSEFTISALLPFQSVQEAFSVLTTNWQPNTSVELQYSFSALQQETNYDRKLSVVSGPTIIEYVTRQNAYIALGICGAIGIIGAGSLLVFGQRRKRSVRR